MPTLERFKKGLERYEEANGQMHAKCHGDYYMCSGFRVAQLVKNQPVSAGDARDPVSSLGQEDPLKKETATHSSISFNKC